MTHDFFVALNRREAVCKLEVGSGWRISKRTNSVQGLHIKSIICFAFLVPPQWASKVMNRATASRRAFSGPVLVMTTYYRFPDIAALSAGTLPISAKSRSSCAKSNPLGALFLDRKSLLMIA